MSEECTPSMCESCTSDCADRQAPVSFLEKLKSAKPGCTLLLASPPAVSIEGEDFSPAFSELAEAYEALAQALGIFFVDTTHWLIPTVGDGVHFSERGHRLFALKMGQYIRMLTG